MPVYMHEYIHTYMHTYFTHTNIHACVRSYTHTNIHTRKAPVPLVYALQQSGHDADVLVEMNSYLYTPLH
jgi:hypothetical protein